MPIHITLNTSQRARDLSDGHWVGRNLALKPVVPGTVASEPDQDFDIVEA